MSNSTDEKIDKDTKKGDDQSDRFLPHLPGTVSHQIDRESDDLTDLPRINGSTGAPVTKKKLLWKKRLRTFKKKQEVADVDNSKIDEDGKRKVTFNMGLEMLRSIERQLPPIGTHKGADINPVLNGMRTFCIDKRGITRAVVKSQEPPTRNHPYTICFHFPGTFLTHRYVLLMVRGRITYASGTVISAIEFVDRNVILGTQGLDNRWLITVDNKRAREELLKVGLLLYNRRIALKRYDDILQEEYQEFLQYQALQSRMYLKIEELYKTKKNGKSGDSKLTEEEIKKVLTQELKRTQFGHGK